MSAAHENTTASSVVNEADNTTGNAASFMIYKKQMALIQSSFFWFHVIIIPFGITGNGLRLLVMSQKQNYVVTLMSTGPPPHQ